MLQVEVAVLPIPRFRHVAIPKCPSRRRPHGPLTTAVSRGSKEAGAQMAGVPPFAHVGSSVVIGVKDGGQRGPKRAEGGLDPCRGISQCGRERDGPSLSPLAPLPPLSFAVGGVQVDRQVCRLGWMT